MHNLREPFLGGGVKMKQFYLLNFSKIAQSDKIERGKTLFFISLFQIFHSRIKIVFGNRHTLLKHTFTFFLQDF